MKTVKIDFEEIPKHSNTPILTYCRKLIKDGFDPNTRLEVFRNNKTEPDIICPNIGKAAELSVSDTGFVKYRPFSRVRSTVQT